MDIEKFSLSGRVIVITGGAGLLGRRHAEAILAVDGTPILWDIDRIRLDESLEYLRQKTGIDVDATVLDITSEAAVIAATKLIQEKYGTVYGLVNNAANNPKREKDGITSSSRLENFSVAQWNTDISVGLTGAFLCAKHLGPLMFSSEDGGSIVNVSSDLGLIAPDQSLYEVQGNAWDAQPVKPVSYPTVKAGLIGLTRFLATYWPGGHVRCNALCPGGIEAGQDKIFLERVSKLIPMRRLAKADEYQGVLIFLLSDASSYCTGSIFSVDGGRTAK
jgi:NAD(P)-dependent dehydrogenase (short-subunit alcohol dehydrogenase family)